MFESSHEIVTAGLTGVGDIFQSILASIGNVGGSLGEAIQNLVDALFGAL